jgi:DNA-binding response OmpR family regulator
VANYSVKNELGEDISVEEYVEKPFRLEEMVEHIRGLLQE